MAIHKIETKSISAEALDDLRSRIQGEVIAPGDASYDAERMAWNLTVDQHPALIVKPVKTEDIVATIQFANQIDLPVSVQSTGHGVTFPANGSMLINTSLMNGVTIDSNAQTATIQAGATWGIVLERAQTAGLAPLLGSSPGVGAIGYTLGGGLGWLARKYGLATDSVRSFELVSVDGRLLQADPTQNSDLFWALRGGGGSFAIVTAMEIQLYPVSEVFGGTLIYPVDMAEEVFRRYRQWIESTPEEFTTSIKIANFPDLPIVPEQFRGHSFVMINGCYCGSVEQGPAHLDDWLEWSDPIQNSFRVMPFSEVSSISNDPENPLPGLSSGAWLRELDDQAIDTLVRYGVSTNGSSPLTLMEVRHISGAMGRAGAGIEGNAPSAFGYRGAPLVMHMVALTPSPEIWSHANEYIQRFKTELAPAMAPGVYLNFLEGEEASQRAKEAFPPEIYNRLKEVKARHDPANRLQSGFGIPNN